MNYTQGRTANSSMVLISLQLNLWLICSRHLFCYESSRVVDAVNAVFHKESRSIYDKTSVLRSIHQTQSEKNDHMVAHFLYVHQIAISEFSTQPIRHIFRTELSTRHPLSGRRKIRSLQKW